MPTPTDPLADLLSALANASRASLDSVVVPNSRFKQAVLRKLQGEGFIKSFRALNGKGRRLEVQMIYGPKREPLLNGIKRVSRPGRRVYVGVKDLGEFRRRLEVPVLSTPQGILTGAEAVTRKTGGELLCLIW